MPGYGVQQQDVVLNSVLPHGEPEKVFDNIWVIQGQVKLPILFPPMRISKAMTIIRNPENNHLTLVNAMPLSAETLQKLQQLGEIRNTLRIGGFHGRDDNFYRVKFGAKVYTLKGHVYAKQLGNMPAEPEAGYMLPDVLLDEMSELPFSGAGLKIFRSSKQVEAILLLKQEGGILVTADALQNSAAPDCYYNWPAKVLMKRFGFFKPCNVGPGWLKFARPSLREIRSILDMTFDHVLPGHGAPVIGAAKEKYRPVLNSAIKGCRD